MMGSSACSLSVSFRLTSLSHYKEHDDVIALEIAKRYYSDNYSRLL